MAAKIDYLAFDADNHYYEAEDAFMRHVPRDMQARCMQWAIVNNKKRLLVGGRVNRFIPNPTFDPVARAGCLDQYFRAKQSAQDIRAAFGELVPIDPGYRDPVARVKIMDEQRIESTFMFPTLGVGMEAALEPDTEAVVAAFRAFNRWLADDWQLNYENRIFSAPYITLADVDAAIAELEWALERDCRVINLRASSIQDADGHRYSFGHPRHDPFWERLNESGITMAMHSGDAGYGFLLEFWGQNAEFEAFRYAPFKTLLSSSPISDALASLIAENVLTRHPRIRVATIESGSEWVGPLFKKLKKAYGQHSYAFAEDPIETFRRQIFVSPYYEDDLMGLREMIGSSHILFGSDWPHAEGLPEPVEFVHDLGGFSAAEVKMIMRDNGMSLITPSTA